MLAAKCRGVEVSRRFEYTPDFAQRSWQVRDVIEHVIGNHGVETRIRKGQLLGVGDLVGKAFLAKKLSRLLEHPRREVRKSDLPACRDALAVAPPESARSAAQFQEFASLIEFEMVKGPAMESVFVDAKTPVQINAGTEVRGILILTIQELRLIAIFVHFCLLWQFIYLGNGSQKNACLLKVVPMEKEVQISLMHHQRFGEG